MDDLVMQLESLPPWAWFDFWAMWCGLVIVVLLAFYVDYMFERR